MTDTTLSPQHFRQATPFYGVGVPTFTRKQRWVCGAFVTVIVMAMGLVPVSPMAASGKGSLFETRSFSICRATIYVPTKISKRCLLPMLRASFKKRPLSPKAIIEEGLVEAGLERAALAALRKSDPRKVQLARAVRKECAVPLKWLGEELQMGGAMNVSRLTNAPARALKHAQLFS